MSPLIAVRHKAKQGLEYSIVAAWGQFVKVFKRFKRTAKRMVACLRRRYETRLGLIPIITIRAAVLSKYCPEVD